MMAKFAESSKLLRRANGVTVAIMQLAMRDYEVLKFTSGEQRASIQIDRPLEGVEHRLTQHGNRTFGSCEYYGCRIYWVHENPN